MECAANGYYEVPDGKVAAVVTYLEMTARPSRGDAPPRDDLSLRPVPQPDPAWYRDLFDRVGRDWLWFGRLGLDDAALAAIIGDPAVEVFALEHEGCDKGLLELDRRKPPDVELAYFGVTADLIGAGAGRWLMDQAIERAFAQAPRRFWVHTCTLDHHAALGFYVRSGFTPYKRAVEIDDDPRLGGLLPRDAAPRVPLIG